MYQKLEEIRLNSGEITECGLVTGPDDAWAQRLETLLAHKGGLWNWQNSQALRTDTGMDSRYYVLHRGGEPFANVCIFATGRAGILGHVWTQHQDRKKGASSGLIRTAMSDFAGRGGQALFLGTDINGVAYKIYQQNGFMDLDGTGHMAWYANGREVFEKSWFKDGAVEIEHLCWQHWPAATPLFLQPGPGIVRCAPLRVFWTDLIEGPLLPAIQAELRRQSDRQPPAAVVLKNKQTQAVLGLALWQPDPIWPDTCLVDVFCHPESWNSAGKLLTELQLPTGRKYVAFGDSTCPAKQAVLKAAGFSQVAVLPGRITAGRGRTDRVDVVQWERWQP